MQPVKMIRSKTVVLPFTDVDTDQIIPARFLTTTSREGLGKHAFADWRCDASGQLRSDFILNQPQARGCEVLVAGDNFGCGSSREHAPWALLDYGFRAVISTGIADIFRSNALKNGLLPVEVDQDTHRWLLANPGVEVEIDLQNTRLNYGDHQSTSFPVESFARYCLLEGIDALGYLLGKAADIERFEKDRSCVPG